MRTVGMGAEKKLDALEKLKAEKEEAAAGK